MRDSGKMEVKIKTLTPLWTGGAETGKCDRIHETGILTYHLKIWREMNSIRDTVTPNEDKAEAFLHHLLQPEKKHN